MDSIDVSTSPMDVPSSSTRSLSDCVSARSSSNRAGSPPPLRDAAISWPNSRLSWLWVARRASRSVTAVRRSWSSRSSVARSGSSPRRARPRGHLVGRSADVVDVQHDCRRSFGWIWGLGWALTR